MFTLGYHASIAKGFAAAAKEAAGIGANTFQFFTRNPRGGSVKALDLKDIAALTKAMETQGFGALLAHAPYTYNFCSDKASVREFAIEAFREDLWRLEQTPCTLFNFHPGSHVGQGESEGIAQIVAAIDAVLDPNHKTQLLLEGMAGKGTEIGGRFEHLAEIIARVKDPERMGICLDTCHLYSAGYDIAGDLDGVLAEFDAKVGLHRLKAIHLNDSLVPFASLKDRHAPIGEGTLGLPAIEAFINHPKLKHLPFFLETPNELPGYQREIALLKGLRSSAD